MKRARKPKAAVQLVPGDLVLLGRGLLLPRDWYRAAVVWTDGEQLLVRMWGFGGQGSWLDVKSVDDVRAVGDHGFLTEFEERCKREVAALQADVDAAEQAVKTARAAVWAKLDKIAGTVPTQREARPDPGSAT